MSSYISQIQEAEQKAHEIIESANAQSVKVLQEAKEEATAHVARLHDLDREEAHKKLDAAKTDAAHAYNHTASTYSVKMQAVANAATQKGKTVVDDCVAFLIQSFA